jgi:hypothetical protein
MSKTIRFKIHGGRVEIEGEGFHGPACDAAISRFLRALAGEVQQIQMKPEYYQPIVETQEVGQDA